MPLPSIKKMNAWDLKNWEEQLEKIKMGDEREEGKWDVEESALLL